MALKITQLIHRYFKRVAGVGTVNYIYFWKSKGLSAENIKAPTTNDYSLNPKLCYFYTKTKIEFSGSCLKQDKIIYDHGKIVNIYIIYKISKICIISSYPTLKNCLFGAVSLSKNAEIDKCKYSGYGIGIWYTRIFSHPSEGTGRNVIIFAVNMSSSTKIDNRKRDILIFA